MASEFSAGMLYISRICYNDLSNTFDNLVIIASWDDVLSPVHFFSSLSVEEAFHNFEEQYIDESILLSYV